MLLFSFVLTAGLELVLIYKNIVAGSWSLVWSFGFLLTMTLFSVHLEDTTSGKASRKFFKALGIKSESYDLLSNTLRSLIYLFTLAQVISYNLGALFAYIVVFVSVILIYTKFTNHLQGKK